MDLPGKMVNGWGISGIVTYQSGFPIRIQTQNDSELQSSFDFEVVNTPRAMLGTIHFPESEKERRDLCLDSSNISSSRRLHLVHSATASRTVLRSGDQ